MTKRRPNYPELLWQTLQMGQQHPDPEVAAACRHILDGIGTDADWRLIVRLRR